jgi:hypothetical protein
MNQHRPLKNPIKLLRLTNLEHLKPKTIGYDTISMWLETKPLRLLFAAGVCNLYSVFLLLIVMISQYNTKQTTSYTLII